MDVVIDGTIHVAFDGVGLIVGDESSLGRCRNIYINKVTHETYNDTNVSVKVVGLTRGNVTMNYVPYILLYADGDTTYGAIGYSNFNVGTCRRLILTDNADASKVGWINENIFNVNRVTELLEIKGNTFCHDNNIFIKPCIEAAKLKLSNCCRNKFYDIRTEGNFTAEFDEKSKYNYCSSNFHWALLDYPSYVTDKGRNNIFTVGTVEALDKVPFYIITKNTFNKYEVSQPEKFNVEGSNVTPVSTYAKLLNGVDIPVDGVGYIGMENSNDCFQLYVTPLDDDKNIITNNPLDYTGGVIQHEDGTYKPTAETSKAFIEIVDKNVKYLRLTLDCCANQVESFDSVVLYAMASKFNSIKLHVLAESLRK